jgi:type I restriction enzyme M protein
MNDSKLRDLEKVRLAEEVETCFRRKVLPHAVDAWIDPEENQGRR